jgi:hypothetical protein
MHENTRSCFVRESGFVKNIMFAVSKVAALNKLVQGGQLHFIKGSLARLTALTEID